jgi:hypothetical protein
LSAQVVAVFVFKQSYLSGLSPSRTHAAYFPIHTFAHPPLVSIDFRELNKYGSTMKLI